MKGASPADQEGLSVMGQGRVYILLEFICLSGHKIVGSDSLDISSA